jgi:hypothetical protein
MKPLILFLIVLFVFLFISLGINYSNVFKYTLDNVQKYKPTLIPASTKYVTPNNYYSDVSASQGVFAKTVPLPNYTIEPMVKKSKKTPKESVSLWGGLQGLAYAPTKEGYTNISWPTVQSAMDYPNNDLGSFTLSTSDCKNKCANTPGCVGIVTANEGENKCWLKSKFENGVANNDRNTYMMSTVTVDPEPTNTNWEAKPGTQIFGNDLGCPSSNSTWAPTNNVDECKTACQNTSGCNGITVGGGNVCCLNSVTSNQGPQTIFDSYLYTPSATTPDSTSTTTSDSTTTPTTTPTTPTRTKPTMPTTMPSMPTKPSRTKHTIPTKPTMNTSPTFNISKPSKHSSFNIPSSLPEPASGTSSTASGWSYNGPNVNAGKYSGPNISALAASGPNNSGYIVQGPGGNVYSGSSLSPQVGGCSSTQYGCCPDNVTAKNVDGSNCSPPPPPPHPTASGWLYTGPNVTLGNYTGPNVNAYAASGPNNSGYVVQGPNGNVYANTTPTCNLSQYGCCPDNITAKNVDGSNCLPVIAGGCTLTPYGCCPDNTTAKNADGSNCPAPATASGWLFNGLNVNAGKFSGPNVTAYAAQGPNNSGYVIQGPNGNVYTGSTSTGIPGGCVSTQYGCCPDNITAKNSDGTNCAAVNCTTSQYGCCPDNVTVKNADGSNCSAPSGGCVSSQYGCCQDGITVKNANGSNCSPYPPPPVQPTTNTVFIPPPSSSMVENSQSSTSTDTTSDVSDSTSSTCPSCPTPQPCPPCGRCPEPSFDCKKVPNYSSTNSEYLPMPVLSDFSQFGM